MKLLNTMSRDKTKTKKLTSFISDAYKMLLPVKMQWLSSEYK